MRPLESGSEIYQAPNSRTEAGLVWIPGALWLAYGIPNVQPQRIRWKEVTYVLFPLRQDECGVTECLYILLFTWPALNAAAYSLGAWIGILFAPQIGEPPERYTNSECGTSRRQWILPVVAVLRRWKPQQLKEAIFWRAWLPARCRN